jgi:hypothetical protein
VRTLGGVKGWTAAVLAASVLSACGAGQGGQPPTATTTTAAATAPAGPLVSFQLPDAGTPGAAYVSGWRQYGAHPEHRTLTINALSLYDQGSQPLILLGIRQAQPVPGLTFERQVATTTAGFESYSEQVNAGGPGADFGLQATFTPVDGYLVEPDPGGQTGDLTPTLVLTAVASRTGEFHLGDWLITYRLNSQVHTLRLADHGEFCVGGSSCPRYG